MKRLQYDRYGGPEVMRLAEFEPPRPGPDEVLVRVRAAASNALDWKMRNGEMKLMGRPVTADLAEVARTLRLPIARTVPLAEAIPALTELEREQRPKGGKLIIAMAGS